MRSWDSSPPGRDQGWVEATNDARRTANGKTFCASLQGRGGEKRQTANDKRSEAKSNLINKFKRIVTDNSDSNRRVLLIFLVIWGIVNLLQAAFTPLHNDEAYYWMYSRYPAWGYYDHPPMIAMLILAGSILIKGELGVRLLVVASQLVTLRLAWELTDEDARKRKGSVSVFITLVLLMPLLHVYGFIAVPDSPLLLFTAFYLLRSFRAGHLRRHQGHHHGGPVHDGLPRCPCGRHG